MVMLIISTIQAKMREHGNNRPASDERVRAPQPR